MSWIKYQPEGKLHVLDQIFPEGFTIPDYFVGKSILHLPTVKCHIYTGMTGAMKNAFGGLLNKKRHYTHSVIHETLVDLLMVQREIHSGIFTVMDGTICGDGAGPRTMTPVVKNYMLASADSVAIDATSAKMMGLEPLGVKCIRMAHEEGLGVGDPAQIQYEGVDISDVNFGFAQTDNAVSKVGKLIWFGPFKHLQWFLFHTPLLYAFVFGSFFYHDYIWWPIEGKRRMREVAKTEWGKLFDAYPE
ncbi:MAG: DUF362 domain-containing protein, partial [Candidatus Hydrogenedentes bacterium]|nr:DUF362 domain-containing protein [Candidatus Hydrogenedentota bacterium]